jgi:hypothetical protein
MDEITTITSVLVTIWGCRCELIHHPVDDDSVLHNKLFSFFAISIILITFLSFMWLSEPFGTLPPMRSKTFPIIAKIAIKSWFRAFHNFMLLVSLIAL